MKWFKPTLQPSDDDTSLVKEYRVSGDLKVLGALYEHHIPLVYGVCLKYMKNAEDAQDAVMAIFEKLVVDLKRHEVNNFKSWLHVTTKNHCLMKLRSARKMELTGDENLSNNMEFGLASHHLDEDRLEDDLGLLKACIEELKDAQKTSVKLFFLEQKCYQQIVESTGFDMKQVKSYIQNGKRNLKSCVEKKREQSK